MGGDFGFPLPASTELRDRLAMGSAVVPGVCFVHRHLKRQGVILACEPWCTAPAIWRAQTGAPSLRRGEGQPFYHCAWEDDARDEKLVGFVAEEDIKVSDIVFPLKSGLVDTLLTPSRGLAGYIASRRLEELLRRQRTNGFFSL